MKRRWLIAAFLASGLFSVLWLAPAANLYHWFAPEAVPVQPSGMHGSVTRGRADAIHWQGKAVSRDLQWRLRLSDLLRLRAGWQIRFSGPATGELQVSVSPGGWAHGRNGRVVAELAAMLRTFGYPGLPIQGQVGLELTQLRLAPHNGLPDRAAGELELRNLAWVMGENVLSVGDFSATISNDRDGTLRAEIRSAEASPIDASGEAWLRPEDRVYETHIRLRARPDAPEQTANLLRLIGQPDNQGYYHLRQRGTL